MLTYRIIIVFRPDSVPIRARPRQPSFLAESLKRAGLYVQARYGVYRILVTSFIVVEIYDEPYRMSGYYTGEVI